MRCEVCGEPSFGDEVYVLSFKRNAGALRDEDHWVCSFHHEAFLRLFKKPLELNPVDILAGLRRKQFHIVEGH